MAKAPKRALSVMNVAQIIRVGRGNAVPVTPGIPLPKSGWRR